MKKEINSSVRTKAVRVKYILGPLVTYEVFPQWKEKKKARKIEEAEKKKKEEEKKSKNKALLRTGRELFTYDPTLFVDDAEAADDLAPVEEMEEEKIEEERMEEREEDDEGEGEEKEEEGEDRAEAEPTE